MSKRSFTNLHLTTAPTPGAVGLVQLHGPDAVRLLKQLTGRSDWPEGRLMLCRFERIDTGLAVRIGDDRAQIMPHGGPRVVQRLMERLVEWGARVGVEPSASSIYPEAASAIEADALATIARAASPAAVDLLAAQPELWSRHLHTAATIDREAVLVRSRVLNRLVDPPTVVVVGKPNVGKSTLLNTLLGRRAALVADLPGTTRDWVGSRVELTGPRGRAAAEQASSVAVRWLDTPGLHETEDALEHHAMVLAQTVLDQADVLIAIADPATPWPDHDALPRHPDLHVLNKADIASPGYVSTTDQNHLEPLPISASKGHGLDALQDRIIEILGLAKLPPQTLWAFSQALYKALEDAEEQTLDNYLFGQPIQWSNDRVVPT